MRLQQLPWLSRQVEEEQQRSEAEGREASYTLVLSGDFQNCLEELHVINHRFFYSCIFLSRKVNQCNSNQVSSCTEIWQICGSDFGELVVSTVCLLRAHGRDPWKALLGSLNESCLLLVFCEVTLCSPLENNSRALVLSIHRGLFLAVKTSQIWDVSWPTPGLGLVLLSMEI